MTIVRWSKDHVLKLTYKSHLILPPLREVCSFPTSESQNQSIDAITKHYGTPVLDKASELQATAACAVAGAVSPALSRLADSHHRNNDKGMDVEPLLCQSRLASETSVAASSRQK